jgi:DNA-binding MarR family transcriptional regulator
MSGQEPERTVRDLTGMLNHAGHVLALRLAEALAEVGLTPRMQCVLVHALEQDRTQAELASLADLDKTTMVATADQLERAGFARRVPSALDRRARIISVTEAGRQVAVAGQQIVDRVHADALRALAEPAAAAFVAALASLIESPALATTDGGSIRRRRQSESIVR